MIEVREVRRAGDIQIKRLPCRIESIEKAAPDVAIVRFKLPANERLQFLAGQYIDFLLKDGKRRSFSLATPPHDDSLLELHIRHMPSGFFTDALFTPIQGPRDPALRGAARLVLSARAVGQADRVRRGRHRLRADQGDDRACAASRASTADGAVLGRARAARSVPARSPAQMAGASIATSSTFPCCPSRGRRTVDGPHGVRPSRR